MRRCNLIRSPATRPHRRRVAVSAVESFGFARCPNARARRYTFHEGGDGGPAVDVDIQVLTPAEHGVEVAVGDGELTAGEVVLPFQPRGDLADALGEL